MPQAVRLPTQLVEQAQVIGSALSRSGAKQIEHWVKIGRIAEENPDLPYEIILQILISKAEKDSGQVSDYEFDS